MKPGDLQLKTTTSRLKYFILSERAMKNHPGGISDNEDENQSAMMAWCGNPCCPVACLEKYLVKREPQCDALWQKPKIHNASSFYSTDEVWFCNAPMGKHKLENLLMGMCKKSWPCKCLHSPLHSSHIGNCPQNCWLRKLPSEECNRPCK